MDTGSCRSILKVFSLDSPSRRPNTYLDTKFKPLSTYIYLIRCEFIRFFVPKLKSSRPFLGYSHKTFLITNTQRYILI